MVLEALEPGSDLAKASWWTLVTWWEHARMVLPVERGSQMLQRHFQGEDTHSTEVHPQQPGAPPAFSAPCFPVSPVPKAMQVQSSPILIKTREL